LFQRRLKYEKVNGWTTSDGNTSPGPGELKNYEKRAITPRRVIRFDFKIAGQVDLDKLNMFPV
jgi:hypothetical protein